MLDVLMDAVIDTLKLIPFLFVTYILMECLEHKTSNKTKNMIKNAGVFGPVLGGMLGAVPQCGFSTAASNFYVGRVISMGTLVAIYLSTSDEMLPIMISEKAPASLILLILGLKVVIGVIAGLVIDFITGRRRTVKKIQFEINGLCQTNHCNCDRSIFKSSVKHTIVISFFIFVLTLMLNILIYFVGEDAIATFILNEPFLGPIISGIVGLIPNCAASVVITQLYLENLISFGSMMAGLLAGSGVGMLVLCRVNRKWKENVTIIATVYLIGVLCGLFIDLIV